MVSANPLNRYRIADLFPTLAFDPETFLFYQGDRSVAFGFLCTPLPGVDDQYDQRMSALLTYSWPPNTLLQFCLWASPDVEHILHRKEMRTLSLNRGQREAGATTAKMCEFIRERTQRPFDTGLLVRDINLLFVAILPISGDRPSKTEIEQAVALRSAAEQFLINLQLAPVAVDVERYLRLMDTLINWKNQSWRLFSTSRYDPFATIGEQIVDFDMNLDVDASGITLGEKRVKVLSVKRFPPTMVAGEAMRYLGDFMSGTRGIRQNCVITLNLFYPDQEKTRFSLENKRLWIIRQASTPVAKYLPDLADSRAEFDELSTNLGEGDAVVKVALGMLLYADRETESKMTTNARVYFRELGFQLIDDHFFCLPLFLHYLPFGASRRLVNPSFRYKTLSTRQAIPLVPAFSDWKGSGTSTMNFVSRSGQLMSLSLYDSDSNYNCCIAAQSGSGKSFLANQLILSYLAEGAKIWVIDVGRSYKNLCELLGGDFMEFGHDSRICLNPFEAVNSWEEDCDMLAALIEAMAAPREGLTDLQVAGLKRALKSVFDRRGRETTIDDLAQTLRSETDRRLIDIGDQLYPFTAQGEYGRFVNGRRTISFNKDFTVLELEELKGRKHLQQIILLLLIYAIQQEMYLGRRDRPKLLIIDEAWDLLTEGDVARFVEHGYRRFRKYGGSAITITQGVDDFYRNNVGVAIVANSAHMYLLRQKEESIERIKRDGQLAMSEFGYELLKTVHTIPGKYSEIFFKTPFGSGIGRLYVPDRLRLLYSTKPDEVEAIRRLREQGVPLMEAIDRLVVNNGG